MMLLLYGSTPATCVWNSRTKWLVIDLGGGTTVVETEQNGVGLSFHNWDVSDKIRSYLTVKWVLIVVSFMQTL